MQLHAGYITDGVKNYLYNRNGPLDWKDIVYFLSVFELEAKEDLSIRNKESLFAVADNIISRGSPTKPSIFIEQTLSETFNWAKREISPIGEISYKLNQENEDLLLLLRRSFVAIDPRISNINYSSISDSQSSLEKEFYENSFGKVFGDFYLQILEPQRSLPDIIRYCGNELTKNLFDLSNKDFVQNNKVDFSIQFPRNNANVKNGLIIEIDDLSHSNTAQTQFDFKRDKIISEPDVNWGKTIRLRKYGDLDEVSTIPSPIQNNIENFLQHPYSQQLKKNYNDPIYNSDDGLDALQLALTPVAVARIQKLFIKLLSANILKLDQVKWNIAILERDVPCGFLAITDLKDLLINLFVLRYGNCKFPDIELRIYNTAEFQNVKLSQRNITELYADNPSEINEFNADILIDVSILQRPGFTKPSQEFLRTIGDPKVFIVRSCYAPKSEHKITIAPKVCYPALNDSNKKQNSLKSLKYFLRYLFRKVGFRSGQLEIINKAIQGKNVIGLLPTGSGKSLCYQICSMLQPGITIIIDPLISLMKDQVQNLESLDIHCIEKINSEVKNAQERSFKTQRMIEGYFQFIFISPERFQIPEFRDAMLSVKNENKFLQVVIDEAHCVSEWGFDFRPAYLHLGKNARNLIGEDVILFGLTGTASFDVLSDVAREVRINQQSIVESISFDRKELRFAIQSKRYQHSQQSSKYKSTILAKVLKTIHRYFGYKNSESFYNDKDENGYVNCGLIFCPHGKTNYNEFSPYSVGTVYWETKEFFERKLNLEINLGKYSGDLDNETRNKEQDLFKKNKTQILVSTCAFGMGIDKPNIRYIIHYSCPQSIEAYYQEAGRAGRDRRKALCISIFSDDKIFIKREGNGFSKPFQRNISVKEFLDNETEGSEAIEIDGNGNVINSRFNHTENVINNGILYNYSNYYLSAHNSHDQITRLPELPFGVANDACRRIYFQDINYPGKETERKIFGAILSVINLHNESCTIPFVINYRDLNLNDKENGNGYVERGIYRMVNLGLIKDYVKDYNAKQYIVQIAALDDEQILNNVKQYVARYKSQSEVNNVEEKIREIVVNGNNQRLLYKTIYYMIDFIYENIERKRRNALREFIRTLRIGSTNIVKFRNELDNYFNSKYLPELRDYVLKYDLEILWLLINTAGNNYNDIRHLHGAVVRLLIVYDDNLLFKIIRSYTSFFHPEYNKTEAMENFMAFERCIGNTDLDNPDRKIVGEWIDRFKMEVIRRQPLEKENVEQAILIYQLSWLKKFNSKFLN